jgi:Phage integrase family
MLRKDLARCGIPFETKEGVADLHSLRHGYITTLGNAGVPIKVLQTLARHADPRLTLNTYSHVSLFDTAGAIESLPDVSCPSQTPQSLAATGTDGPFAVRQPSDFTGPRIRDTEIPRAEGQRTSEDLAVSLPCAGDVWGRIEPQTAAMTRQDTPASTNKKPLKKRGFDASSQVEPQTAARVDDGIRTRDTQIHNLVP